MLTLLTSGQERGHVLVLLPQSIKRNPVLVSFSRHWTQRQIYYLKRFGKLEKFWGEPETDDFIIYLFIYLLVFLPFLGPLPWPMEIFRLGVESEL